MNKKYAIPALGLLSTAMTTGCSDPVVGDWDLNEAELSYGGYDYSISFPYESCYDGYYATYCYSMSASLNVDEALLASWLSSSEYSVDGAVEESYAYTADGTVVPGDEAGSYNIDLTDEDGETLELSCTLAEDNLDCVAEEDGMTMTYKMTRASKD